MSEDKTVRGSNIAQDDHFHLREYGDAFGFTLPADTKLLAPKEKPKLCIYCNAPWTERMETIYIESGYCESCYDSEATNVIVCDKCNRIVYAK
jgi:hypothetical protein